MLSVRVPPSASQHVAVDRDGPLAPRRPDRSPRRRLRPINRWISLVRPSNLPLRSRRFRGAVLPGNMLYSAVTQPRPCPAIQGGNVVGHAGGAEHGRPPGTESTRSPDAALVKWRLTLIARALIGLTVVVTHVGQSFRVKPQSDSLRLGCEHTMPEMPF